MKSYQLQGKISKSQQIINATERRLATLDKIIVRRRITLEALEIEAESLKRILKLYQRKELETN